MPPLKSGGEKASQAATPICRPIWSVFSEKRVLRVEKSHRIHHTVCLGLTPSSDGHDCRGSGVVTIIS